jgi:hypothetical protein
MPQAWSRLENRPLSRRMHREKCRPLVRLASGAPVFANGAATSAMAYALAAGGSSQGSASSMDSRSAFGNALRRVPVLGGVLGGVGDMLSGIGNLAIGRVNAGSAQFFGGLARTARHVWALPNTAVGLVYGGTGMLFGATPVWDANDTILRFKDMPGWLMPSAMSMGHVQVYGPGVHGQLNRFGVPIVMEENLHTRQAEILGPTYFPLHGLSMFGSLISGGGTHDRNLLEIGPERGRGPWPWSN